MDNRPIGIMDSGVGGLTVARYLKKKYPDEGIVFIGDTAHNPYGDKTKEEITTLASSLRDYLLKKQVKMIIVGCNTISFNAAPSFFDCEVPVVRMSLNMPALDGVKEVAVLATPATIATHRHKHLIHEKYPWIQVHELGFPGLAHAIEMGESRESMESIVRRGVQETGVENTEYAFLACTHYPLEKELISRYLPHAAFWDPAEITVEEGMNLLKSGHQLAGTPQPDQFCFTESGGTADTLVKSIFGSAAHAETVDTGE